MMKNGAFGEKEIISDSAQNWLLSVWEARIGKENTQDGMSHQSRTTPVSKGEIIQGKAGHCTVSEQHLERQT